MLLHRDFVGSQESIYQIIAVGHSNVHRSACWWHLFHVSTWPALASVEITKKSVFLSTTSQPGPLELQAHYGLALFIPALQPLLLEGKLFEDCHSLAPLTDTKSLYDTQMITRQCSPHISSTVWEVPFGRNVCFYRLLKATKAYASIFK